ncbi:uncharacterized protein LOC142324869 [Lycorma delicatula]|uniref:uncharacterized protein LOC142324869 n=1 Tax=Lycorma delicatula TaxID=130591 RepID=UPI003F516215
MVFFTCQHCGASLSKSKVEKHYSYECRNHPYVTCVDCLKDFRGNEYVAHTECITEDQKYGGKGFVPKTPPSVKKRATWLSSVESALEIPGLTPAQKNFISSCLECSNLPQKRKKFHNFIKSAFGRACPNDKLVDGVFDILEETHKRNVEKEQAENNSNKETAISNNENSNTQISDHDVEINNDENSKNENNKKSQKRRHSEEQNDETEIKKKKKKDKKKEKLECKDNADILGDQTTTSVELEDTVEDNTTVKEINVNCNNLCSVNQSEKKLTKKEKKEKKKRAKYEAELNEIESNKNQTNHEESANNNDINGNEYSKKKKKKKDKTKMSNGNDENAENIDEKVLNKKKRHDDDIEEPVKKKSKPLNCEDINEDNILNDIDAGKTAFKWDEVIIKVLESRSDKKLSVNRLCKKIINEYQSVCSESHMTYEKLLAKCNKKIHKTPGVKVFKDKAKLID